MPDVVVAIPTFRRPKGLERLLNALEELKTDARVRVLVADNDSDGRQGFEVCSVFRERGYRWPLEAIIVPERGIAQARNALLEAALADTGADFIAMLDDDEWPHPQWLAEFLRVQQQTNTDALASAVLREFDEEPGRWVQTCEGMSPVRGQSGPMAIIDSTASVLVRRACFEDMPKPWFDPAFALTGGEDRDFFTRLKALGKCFAFCDEAIVYAHVPVSRSGLGWALKRAYRVGNSDMRVFLKNRHNAGEMLREVAKIAGALLLSPALLVMLAPIPNRRAIGLMRPCRAVGKIAALFGRHYNEYATVHGD
jgi:glycosyltransferase involved in cell wall biosynthesis